MRFGHPLQKGFAAVAAVVLIVVFALIGTFMLTTVGNQNMTTALSQREVQAWFAAQSGIEWAMRQIISTGSGCPVPCSGAGGGACGAVTGPSPLSLASHATGYDVALSCSCVCVSEGGSDYGMYRVTATATSGISLDPASAYVSRTVQATARE